MASKTDPDIARTLSADNGTMLFPFERPLRQVAPGMPALRGLLAL